jgi:UPF0042 nucleotide-binding protein
MSVPPPVVPPVVIVSGLAGAGRTTAVQVLADLGYEAVDNLPQTLIAPLLQIVADRPLALGADMRTRAFDPAALLATLAASGRPHRLLFLDCDDEALLRRFGATRRPHPVAADRSVADGIALDRRLQAEMRAAADLVVDTTALSPHDLRHLLAGHFALDRGARLRVELVSFAFRDGLPREADLVFDVRFLRNPNYEPDLKPRTGIEAPVRAFVESDPAWTWWSAELAGLLLGLLPRYQADGRSHLTVALGCTGGRHRSVATVEFLAQRLRAADWPVTVRHRDAGLPAAPERSS